jgi:hypothetical protein
VRVERRGLASLAQSGAGVVVLRDVPPPGGAADDALAAWIRQGGGVVIVAGGRLAAAQTSSALLPALLRGTSDRLADRGGTFGEVSLEHPLFVPFRYAPGALQSARFLRYPRLEPAVGADVLARYDDGLPAVVERRVGAGRVILIGVPLDARAGDFPLQPAYLPFLRRLVLHVSGHEASPLWRTTGEHWVVQSAVRQPVVAAPSGDILRPRADSGGAVVAVTDVGFYALHDARVGGDPVAVLAVNPPPGESDLTPVDPRELLLGVGQSDSSTAAAAGPATPVQAERAQSVWRILLLCMAVVLLAETVLANRGWRALGGPRSTS